MRRRRRNSGYQRQRDARRRVEFTGKIGRSQAVSTFGVGSIYELRTTTQTGQALNSVMMVGLDQWDQYRDQLPRIRERHLERVLNKSYFLEPPSEQEDQLGSRQRDEWNPSIPAVRFPRWLVCDRCDRLGVVGYEFEEKGAGPKCRDAQCGGNGFPVRIVVACYHKDGEPDTQPGHIDDFPWSWWAHGGAPCSKPQLKLKSTGTSAGLAGLRVACDSAECRKRGVGRTLEDVFKPEELQKLHLRCRGTRPWLGDAEEGCDRPIRVLMRGASNVYFAVVVSALSIPPNSSFLMQQIGRNAYLMANYGASDIDDLVEGAKNAIHGLRGKYSDKQIADAITLMATGEDESGPSTDAEQRFAERIAIIEERSDEDDRSEFLVERVDEADLDADLRSVTEHLVLADRLREVRVLRGFHRVEPLRDSDPYHVECAPLSCDDLPWLPAIEINGEGIYFELEHDLVQAWASRDSVSRRMALIQANVDSYRKRRGIRVSDTEPLSPQLVLVHTLCHLMINQLSMDCGYSSASLRERLYVNANGTEESNGFLIYTASPGADGTLGGLVRQGEPEYFDRTLKAALAGAVWCSSDPLCIESVGQGADALNLAACHACCIVSETSCELRNLYLDRGLLVGTPDMPDAGFFFETAYLS